MDWIEGPRGVKWEEMNIEKFVKGLSIIVSANCIEYTLCARE